ncbi:MAG TPA: helix-turn-helix transcriptional regulator [Anditalea sp.]|nr:helix-turn-helix transcriptional regulator [Anditalea sp.]
MKQPQLGQKILEWRKAKGLTQEELVELCQINVRTIQRIEAGEVTPRSYTLKTIMEALDVDAAKIKLETNQAEAILASNPKPDNFLQLAFYLGIFYLITSFAEAFMDFIIWEISNISFSGIWYTIIKLAIVSTFAPFMYGFYLIGKDTKTPLVSVTSLLLIAGVVFSVGKDLYLYFGSRDFFVEWMMVDAFYFGPAYILFSIGLIRYQNIFGSIALIAGCLGIITGLAFLSIIFALPGLFLLTLFEILLLVILYSASQKSGSTKLTPPTYSITE